MRGCQETGIFRNYDKGFTLVEMLVVMTLISLSASIAFVSYRNNSESAELGRVSQQIVRLLRTARVDAVLKQRNQRVSFNLNDRSFRKLGKSAGIPIPKEIQIRITAAAGQLVKTNAASGNEVGIQFFATGGSTGGNILIGRHNSWNRITVDWLLGTVSFEANVDEK